MDSQSGASTTVNATTDAQGRIVASAGASAQGLVLAPGSLVVSAVGADGTQYYGVPGTGTDPDCVASGSNCNVTLNHDRNIAFEACVVPNPDGSPLPAGTPDPIPGAVTKPPLEAIGCWTRQNGTSNQDATMFTSNGPIRLDGIDVRPASGTTFTLDSIGSPTVTSSGPAQLVAAGVPITPMVDLSLTYPGPANPAGDWAIGRRSRRRDGAVGAEPVRPSGPASAPAVPSAMGCRSSNPPVRPLSISGRKPRSRLTRAPLGTSEKGVPGRQGQGRTEPGHQRPVDVQQPHGPRGAAVHLDQRPRALPRPLRQAQRAPGLLDTSAAPVQLSVSGMFEMPTALEHFAGDINATVTFQNVASSDTGQLQGYKVQAAQLEFDHLSSSTFGLPPARPSFPTRSRRSASPGFRSVPASTSRSSEAGSRTTSRSAR